MILQVMFCLHSFRSIPCQIQVNTKITSFAEVTPFLRKTFVWDADPAAIRPGGVNVGHVRAVFKGNRSVRDVVYLDDIVASLQPGADRVLVHVLEIDLAT